jgi:hypothetical protein
LIFYLIPDPDLDFYTSRNPDPDPQHCLKYLQSFPISVEEGLAEALVLRNGLEDVPVSRHVANGPLAQPRATQPEHVAENIHNNYETHYNKHCFSFQGFQATGEASSTPPENIQHFKTFLRLFFFVGHFYLPRSKYV